MLFILALFFDAAATSVFMIQHGSEYELHPLFRVSSAIFGPVYGPLLGAICKVLFGMALVLMHRPLSFIVLPLAALCSLCAGAYNLLAWPLYQMGCLRSLPF